MKQLRFFEGTLPSGYKKESDTFLFNTTAHRTSQSRDGWISFYLLHEQKRKSCAEIHFHVSGDLAESPFRAPFGSFEFSPGLSADELYAFLEQIEKSLRKNGVRKITIRNPPQAYRPVHAPLAEALFVNSGYRIVRAEINSSVAIGGFDFTDIIDPWETRKWRQSKKQELIFHRYPASALRAVYEFIASCRAERGYTLSMSSDELADTVLHCPGAWELFGVLKDNELVAASVLVRVNKTIAYNFYSAHSRRSDPFSPVVFLMDGLYTWCKKENFELLDLGTSALGDRPNFGLLEFKTRLGGQPSVRYSYEKKLT